MKGRGETALLACLVVLASPGAADAKKKPKKAPAPVTVKASQSSTAKGTNVTAVATCPKGMIVTGGGWSSPYAGSGLGVSAYAVWESKRVGTNAWTVSGLREDSGDSGASVALTAVANCRPTAQAKKKGKGKAGTAKTKKPKKLKVSEATGTAPAPGNASGTAVANCPKGQKVVGGGFSSAPAPSGSGMTAAFPFFWQSRRNGTSAWQASATTVNNTARTITSYAYCAPGAKASETEAATTIPGASVGGITFGEVSTGPCPKKTWFSGGGFNNPQVTFGMTSAPLMLQSSQNGKTWTGGAVDLSVVPATITVKGYCF